MTVNIPPKSGPFYDATDPNKPVGYAEVIITYNQPRYFSRIWGSASLPITARAVAIGTWKSNGNGIILLDPTAAYALDASGGGSLTVTGDAAVIVDSNNASAARVTGGGSITADNFLVTGGTVGTFTGDVQTGSPPIPDPLRNLPVPPVPPNGTLTKKQLGNGNTRYTLSPGRYGTNGTKLPSVFNPGDEIIFQQASAGNGGVFYIDGGGFTSTGASLTMDPNTKGGIMIYNVPKENDTQNQTISIQGNDTGKVYLTPLTSGSYAGMILWQKRESTVSMSISGQGNFTILGTMYAANAQLSITGGGSSTIGSQYISRTLTLSGQGTILIDYSVDNTAKQRDVYLVE